MIISFVCILVGVIIFVIGLMQLHKYWFERNRCYRRYNDSATYVYIRHEALASGINGVEETVFVFLFNKQTRTIFQFSLNEFNEQFIKVKDFKEE